MPKDDSPPSLPPSRLALLGALWALIVGLGAALWTSLPLGLLAAAGLVLTLVIGFMWQSLQHLSGDTELSFEEALGLGAPTAEEEQKRAVLRALKDLEYERSVGKISEADFHELSARYRAEAKRLILVVDEVMLERRRAAEALLAERLGSAATSQAPAGSPQPRKKRRRGAKPVEASDHADSHANATEEGFTEDPSEDGAPEPRAEEKSP